MQRRLLHSALVFTLLGSGCELVADFDRTKIPGAEVDSGKLPVPDDEEDAGQTTADAATAADAGDDDSGT